MRCCDVAENTTVATMTGWTVITLNVSRSNIAGGDFGPA
jgi:hypothetical protein